jgi:hypothetical protein
MADEARDAGLDPVDDEAAAGVGLGVQVGAVVREQGGGLLREICDAEVGGKADLQRVGIVGSCVGSAAPMSMKWM